MVDVMEGMLATVWSPHMTDAMEDVIATKQTKTLHY